MVFGIDSIVGSGSNVGSVSKVASRWCKDSTLCVGRQQVRGVDTRGVVCMGEGCRGVGRMGGWVMGDGRYVRFHWYWFHYIVKEECG